MITIRNLSHTYPDGTRALEAITLTFARGESVGIIGANGAGKSTLANHLNGWLLPQQGTVAIAGLSSRKENLESIRRKVGLLFQKPDDQLFMARLLDDVLFGPMNLGMPMEEAETRAERLLRSFALWELRHKPPFHLSQGQKRFAALAAVLVMQPEVLVMDEPTSDLDPRNRRKLIELSAELPATTITISHDLDYIWDTCTTAVLMANGRIVTQGPARELLANEPLLLQNNLELPLRLQ